MFRAHFTRFALRAALMIAAGLLLSGAVFSANAATLPAGFTETRFQAFPVPQPWTSLPTGGCLFVCRVVNCA